MDFKRQLGLANHILANYSKEDILFALDYLKRHPINKTVTSIGYLPYIIDDLLQKASYEKEKESLDMRLLEIEDKTIVEKQNKIKKKSLFGKELYF